MSKPFETDPLFRAILDVFNRGLSNVTVAGEPNSIIVADQSTWSPIWSSTYIARSLDPSGFTIHVRTWFTGEFIVIASQRVVL